MTLRSIAFAAVVSVAVLLGCSEEPEQSEPGLMAEMVPADVDAYGEFVVRPRGELLGQIEELVSDFGGNPEEDLADIGAPLIESAGESLNTFELDYEADIQDWLGYRVGGFLRVASSDELLESVEPEGGFGSEASTGAVIIEVTDDEVAAETLERVLGESEETGEGELYRAVGAATVVLIEGHLLIGTGAEVDDALAAAGSAPSLADEGEFRAALDSVDGDSIGFFVGESEVFFTAGFISEGPGFASRFLDEFQTGLDGPGTTGTTLVQLTVQPAGPALDFGYTSDDPVDLEAAERAVGALPADSLLAVGDPLIMPILVDSYALGLDIGIGRAGVTREKLFQRLGYYPDESIARLTGLGAVFARGVPPDLQAGLMFDVKEKPGSGYAVDAARLYIGTEPGAKISARPLRYGGPYGFSASLSAVPEPIMATEATNRLGVILGAEEEELAEVFEPKEALADGDSLTQAADLLGEGWTAIGFADLGAVLEIGQALDPTAVPAPTPELPEGTRVVIGARNEPGIVAERYLLTTGP